MSNGDENRTEAVFIKDTRISSLPNDVMKKWDGWKTKENQTKPWKTISNCEKHAKNIENRFGPHANRDQNWTEAVFIKETRFSSSPNDVMKRWDGWKTKENQTKPWKTINIVGCLLFSWLLRLFACRASTTTFGFFASTASRCPPHAFHEPSAGLDGTVDGASGGVCLRQNRDKWTWAQISNPLQAMLDKQLQQSHSRNTRHK